MRGKVRGREGKKDRDGGEGGGRRCLVIYRLKQITHGGIYIQSNVRENENEEAEKINKIRNKVTKNKEKNCAMKWTRNSLKIELLHIQRRQNTLNVKKVKQILPCVINFI